jgi:hypothetical protein
MKENRPTAAWLRTLASFVALAGVMALSACGGGSGAPNAVLNPSAVSLLPEELVAYEGTPATLTISGGKAPFTIASSNQSVLPLSQPVNGSSIPLLPNNVDADTPVTITVRDSTGASATSAVTVKRAPLINTLTLKADNFDTRCPNDRIGSSTPTDAQGSTWLCSGQTGTVGVRLKTTVGAGISGRLVRFDVVQGDFHLFTNGAGQPETFAQTYTVSTDQDGNAVTRVRADPSAHQQLVIVQATDVITGTFVRGIFVVQAVDSVVLFIVPDTVTIKGPDTQTCSTGVATTFFIYGGQPPYIVSNSFPQFMLLSQTSVAPRGGGFTVTTLGGCFDTLPISVTDAVGHTGTVILSNVLGTLAPPTSTTPIPINVTPSPIPFLGCSASTNVVATGGGTITTTSGTQTTTPATSFFVSVSRPDILSALPPNPAPGATITLNRLNSGTVDPTQPAGATVNVALLVSDGGQVKTVSVPVQNTCP